MKTERAMNLLKHFKQHGVSHDAKASGGLKFVLEWQDIIGQASTIEVVQFEGALPPLAPDGVDRDTFLFVNFQCLRYETTIEIFRQTHGARIKAVLEAEVRQELKACADGLDIGLASNKAKEQELTHLATDFMKQMNIWKLEKEQLQREVNQLNVACTKWQASYTELVKDAAKAKEYQEKRADDSCVAASQWNHLKDLVKELMK